MDFSTQVLTEEMIEKTKKRQEEATEVLTPPKGKVLAGLRSFCPTHGDITRASKLLKYTLFLKNQTTNKVEAVGYSDVLCLACLADMWQKHVVANFPKDENGNASEIKVAPVYLSEKEYNGVLQEQVTKRIEGIKKAIETDSENEELKKELEKAEKDLEDLKKIASEIKEEPEEENKSE